MENTKLQLGEILQLEAEVNGVINPQTQEVLFKGLLKETLKFKIKYWLTQLSDDLSKEKLALEKMRDELIKDLGEISENGSISIPYTIEVKDKKGKVISTETNPKFIEFQEKYSELLNEIKEIKHYKFTLDDFDSIESDIIYPIFFKLISID